MLNWTTIAHEYFHYDSEGISAWALWMNQISLRPKPSSQAWAGDVQRPVQNWQIFVLTLSCVLEPIINASVTHSWATAKLFALQDIKSIKSPLCTWKTTCCLGADFQANNLRRYSELAPRKYKKQGEKQTNKKKALHTFPETTAFPTHTSLLIISDLPKCWSFKLWVA